MQYNPSLSNPSGICFIGAMNHDFVCRCKMPHPIRDAVMSSHPVRSIDFSETAISDDENSAILCQLPPSVCRSELGGSGFNAARSASLLNSYLRLGFVGVVGDIDGKYPHREFLKEKNVETSFLRTESKPCASSISFTYDGDRTLLTAIGANTAAGDYFRDAQGDIVAYLLTFSKIHVTSFLDENTTHSLAELLTNATSRRKDLCVSVDPGAVWVRNLSESVRRVIATSSILHLNEREFSILGGRLRDEHDSTVAQRISKMMRDDRKLIVLRRHRSVTIYDVSAENVQSAVVDNGVVLNDREVVDATGAGDTLTGLLLAVLESDVVTTSLAASVAMNATVEKLRHAGAITGHDLDRGLKKKFGPLNLSSSGKK